MSRKYKFHDPEGLYFISFATVGWIDVLTRPVYKDIIVESLAHCQRHKGLRLFAWTIMSNHIHLLASASEGASLSAIVRDLKKFTSGKIHTAIREHPGESRREWMLELFRKAGEQNKHNAGFQLWQQNNQPMDVSTPAEIDRVVEYIRMNPVVEGIVDHPEAYRYSSAYEPPLLQLEEL
ncbi:MAG TPA: transposase [Flavobacteriales bacterium]